MKIKTKIKVSNQPNSADEALRAQRHKAKLLRLFRFMTFLGYFVLLVRGDLINAIGLSLFYFSGVFKENL